MQRHDSRRLEILRHSGELPPREHDVMAAACVSGSYDLTSQYAAAERRRGRRRVSGAMPALAKGRDGLREDGEEEEKVDGGDGEEKEQDDNEEEEEEGVEADDDDGHDVNNNYENYFNVIVVITFTNDTDVSKTQLTWTFLPYH